MSKLKTNEVVLISPNGLVEKTLGVSDGGVVAIPDVNLTGAPTAPTVTPRDTSTKVATTAYVEDRARVVPYDTYVGGNVTLDSNGAGEFFVVQGASGTIQITIPTGLPIGAHYTFVRWDVAEVQFVAGSGMTLFSTGSKKRINAQYEVATAYVVTTNQVLLMGALKT